jgi:hypothetical protein
MPNDSTLALSTLGIVVSAKWLQGFCSATDDAQLLTVERQIIFTPALASLVVPPSPALPHPCFSQVLAVACPYKFYNSGIVQVGK